MTTPPTNLELLAPVLPDGHTLELYVDLAAGECVVVVAVGPDGPYCAELVAGELVDPEPADADELEAALAARLAVTRERRGV